MNVMRCAENTVDSFRWEKAAEKVQFRKINRLKYFLTATKRFLPGGGANTRLVLVLNFRNNNG